jgi:hypothetical protein
MSAIGLPSGVARSRDRKATGATIRKYVPEITLSARLLPAVSWPHVKLSDLWVLLPSAAGMMLVIFSEALGAGQTFAESPRMRPDLRPRAGDMGEAELPTVRFSGRA